MSFDKSLMVSWIKDLQAAMTSALEAFEPHARFQSHDWERPGGGGGHSRVLEGGEVFEKAGVNISVVHGQLPPQMKERFKSKHDEFFATGISMVIHPRSPQVPTMHANW